MKLRNSALAVLLSIMLVPGLSSAQQGEWLVAPYIWMSDVGWDISARGSGTIAFSDIVDKIDGAGLIRVEYARNQIGFTFDYVGLSLSDSRRISTGGILPVDIDIRANVDMTVFEAGAFWRPSRTDSGIDVIAGFRTTDVDSNLIVTPANTQPQRFDSSSSFTDFYAGARYLHRFTETWDFSIRGDYGIGGSDGALNLMASVGWRTRGAFGMSLAYRHLTFDIDERIEGEPATNKFDFSGPALGFMFRF
ncbi:MAG: hypothetical protein GTO71_08385 [Woeseiaceae bacterium]|nr:hypothetical protein [Woeseiaceae bacterium]NIP21102.1 hypothetical protein [Woeseiaceae bacterium]NIS90074.1 hypothetical protein [Woeseiaceae bacterium]